MNKIQALLTGNCLEISERLSTYLENVKEDLFKRRSRLYIPLINEKFIQNSPSTLADGLIFDLEDSVPVPCKQTARDNIKRIPYKKPGVEYILRINAHQSGLWKTDLIHLDEYAFDSVMIPKVESGQQIEDICNHFPLPGLKRIVLIESIRGLENIKDIANVLGPGDAMGYGAGDLSTSFGIPRAPIHESMLLQHILVQVLMAAKQREIDVFDPPYRDFTDMTALRKEAEFGRQYGTIGKQAVHPSQLDLINQVYSPSYSEIVTCVNEISGFATHSDSQAINIGGSYKGKPSKVFAEQKLCEWVRRGYIKVLSSSE